MLSVGSMFDLWKREVPDKVWVIFGGIGVILTAVDLSLGAIEPLGLLVSLGITAAIAAALYYLRFYGGADAKALVAAAAILPLYSPPNLLHPFAPIQILSNALFASLFLPVALASYNLYGVLRGRGVFAGLESEAWWKKVVACFIGYRAGPGGPKSFHLNLERLEGGIRRFDFSLLKDDEEFAQEGGRWVTPGLPLIVFMLGGAMILFGYGDLTSLIVRALLAFP